MSGRGPEPDDAVGDAEAAREVGPRPAVALAGHEQAALAIAQRARAPGSAGPAPCARSRCPTKSTVKASAGTPASARAAARWRRAVVGMEADEIDAVVDDAQPGRRRVPYSAAISLRRAARSRPRAARSSPEHAPLERQQHAVVGATRPPRPWLEVGRGGSPRPRGRRPGRACARGSAPRPSRAAHRPARASSGNASSRSVRGRRGSGSVRTVTPGIGDWPGRLSRCTSWPCAGQRADEARGGGLHAAVERERPADDDQDLHRARAASARSTSGKQRARARTRSCSALGTARAARPADHRRAAPGRRAAGGSRRRGPATSPGGTSTPQPSRISGIIDTAVETIGRPSAIASKILAGT